jgi:RNA polymerase sigma factor (TIGR02999 family)
MEPASPVTVLLHRWRRGDDNAEQLFVERVYATLHEMAQAKMAVRGQMAGMLQPTALVNEALLRLLGPGADYNDRVHFFATASLKMRAVLVDYARHALAEKRGGGAMHVTLSAAERDVAAGCQGEHEQLLALHQALDRFTALDPRAARAVELSYFGGMTQEEIACAQAVSLATVERDLRIARAWLRRTLADEPPR